MRRDEAASEILLRALEARSEIYLWNGEHALALQSAKELTALEPFREADIGWSCGARRDGQCGGRFEGVRALPPDDRP